MSEQYLEKLIKKVSKLPGLGPRSSRRVVLHLLKDKEKLSEKFKLEEAKLAEENKNKE